MKEMGARVSALDERPELKAEYHWLYDAYRALSRSRQVGGMGEFYIPLTEYAAYCSLMGIPDMEQRIFLINVVSEVDAILLHERYEKQKNT